jgi:DNA polymerase-3 subunit delta'
MAEGHESREAEGPHGLGSIVGHEPVIRRLRRAVQTGRVHHAWLFSGPEGVGKTTVGRALAQALNCGESSDAGCGRCRSCDRLRRGLHPDLMELHAEGTQIKIQQVRDLQARLSQGPHEGRALMILVHEAHRLSVGAANALLKNLEEPRPGVHFVLVSSAPHRLPVTVRSRCQRLRFGPLAESALRTLLTERLLVASGELTDLEPARLDDAIRLSEGRVALALLLLHSEDFPLWQRWSRRLADPAALREAAIPSLVHELLQEVDEPEAVLRLLLPLLRDQLLVAAGLDEQGARLTHLDEAALQAVRARRWAPSQVEGRLEAVQEGLRDLEYYVNKHLALEQVMVRLST